MKTKYLPAIVDRTASANTLIEKQGWKNQTKQIPIKFPQ